MARSTLLASFLAAAMLASHPAPALAYITAPVPTLGAVFADSTYATLVKVEKFDRERGVIVYSKVRDLKGKYPLERMRHVFQIHGTPQHMGLGHVPVRPDEVDWKYAVKWVEVDKFAVVFTRRYEPFGDFGHVYIDGLWYSIMCPGRDWDLWYAIYSDPNLLRQWHAGSPARLAEALEIMATGRTAYVPVLGKGNKAELRAGKATLHTLGASYLIRSFDAKRDILAEPLETTAIPNLLKVLATARDRDQRARAAGALGLIGSNDQAVVEALCRTVKADPSGTVRIAAADALARLRPRPQQALAAVEAALKDPAFGQRRDVHAALKDVLARLK